MVQLPTDVLATRSAGSDRQPYGLDRLAMRVKFAKISASLDYAHNV